MILRHLAQGCMDISLIAFPRQADKRHVLKQLKKGGSQMLKKRSSEARLPNSLDAGIAMACALLGKHANQTAVIAYFDTLRKDAWMFTIISREAK